MASPEDAHIAYGPGEAGYVQQLKDYDKAFDDFFTRLKNDGITKANTLFVVTVEEGDHFAGTAPDAPCDGVTTACTYANGHVTEVNGDLRRIIAKYNADNGTTATTDFSVHATWRRTSTSRATRLATRRRHGTSRRRCSTCNVTNPLSGDAAEADGRDGRSGRGEAPPHGHGRSAADADVHAVRARGLLPERRIAQHAGGPVQRQRSPWSRTTASSCPTSTPPANQTFAWNHGGIQPEVRSTWIGWVGPGVAENGQTDKVWTDHTDIRPTMLALLGLKDDYVSDGRVVTEFLKSNAIPTSLNGNKTQVEDLGAIWKQINASFGQFSLDTLCASTGALASNTLGDSTYTATENALASLGAQRDALADQIRLALWNAEFGNQKIDQKKAKDWINQGQGYLDQAAALCGTFSSSPANAKALDKVNHIVVIYEENHSFDNLYGGWEGVNGLANADAAHTTQVNQAGNAYTCLKQNDVNLHDAPPLPADMRRRDARNPERPVHERLPERPVPGSTTYIAPTDDHVSSEPAGRIRAGRTGGSNGTGSAGRLHPRPGPPLLPRAVPARWRRPGPLRHRQRRDRPVDGRLRHQGPADLHSTCTAPDTRTTRSRTTSSRRRSVDRSSTTSG